MTKQNEQELKNTEDTITPDQEEKDLVDSQEESEEQESSREDRLQKRIEELEDEVSSLKDMNLRKVAEMENMRKRIQRDRIQVFEEAKAGALEDFLPIFDDLDRTLEAAENSKIEDSFLEGVQLVANKFEEVLSKHGVERINEANVPFDVNLHDAMMRQPAPDEETGSDVVLQVLESGYKISGRTIRHAKVIVSE